MRRWSDEIKRQVRKMRLEGASFGQLVKEFGVPKSTLSTLLKDTPKPDYLCYTDRVEWLKGLRVLAAQANKKKRLDRINKITDEVIEDINTWKDAASDLATQKTILAMLYWAEGAKGRQVVQFANTDPQLMLLFITLFRKAFKIDEAKLRVHLHLHYYHRENEAKKFWSDLLNIPENQFYKTYRKKRSQKKTFRRNTGGICTIKYNSVCLQERIMRYAYKIADVLIKNQSP